MAYVPGRKHDLFLSYASVDGAWVDAFRDGLWQGLKEKLGPAVSLWQDSQQLRAGQKWQSEIDEAIQESAAFIAVCSPSFFESKWCNKEHVALLRHHGNNIESLKVDSFYRIFKILKTWDPEKRHETFFQALEHIAFFDKTGQVEYQPGSPQFTLNLSQTVRAIAELLWKMGNGHQRLYLAPGADDVDDECTRLREQLRAYGYKVGGRPGPPAYSNDVLRNEMAECAFVIFVMGATHDADLEHQLKLAEEAGRPIILWLHPVKTKHAEPKQRALIDRVTRQLPPGAQTLGGTSAQHIAHDLVELLKPKSEAAPGIADGERKNVYLLYDTTKEQELETASAFHRFIEDQHLTVFEPDRGAANTDRLVRHEQLMRESDGVLLYRGVTGPDRWLFQSLPEVLYAERMYQRPKPMDAKALLVADPAQVEGVNGVDVIPYRDPFAVESLRPFVEKLKKSRQANAGR